MRNKNFAIKRKFDRNKREVRTKARKDQKPISEMTTQRARLGFGASIANMVEDERAAIENKPVFEIYACLQEKYPDAVTVTNSLVFWKQLDMAKIYR